MAKVVKQVEVTEKVIGENTFYIRPFPAFKAANISGELVKLLSPVMGAIASSIGAVDGSTVDAVSDLKEGNTEGAVSGIKEAAAGIMEMDVDEIAPKLSSALSGLSGDAIERMMKKLLVDYQNISVEGPATDGAVKRMDIDLANEVFCTDLQDMLILCVEVVRVNFKGFFSKIAGLFGDQTGASTTETE